MSMADGGSSTSRAELTGVRRGRLPRSVQPRRYVLVTSRDVPDIRFRLAGYPAIFTNPVPAKMVQSTGYLSRIVLGPFWQLVELSSPSEWAPYSKHVHLNF